jgi:hypothetical protein
VNIAGGVCNCTLVRRGSDSASEATELKPELVSGFQVALVTIFISK